MILIINVWPSPCPHLLAAQAIKLFGATIMARLGRPKSQLTLTDLERQALTHQARSIRRDRARALRARIVLACSDGQSNREVATRLGLAEHTVGKWRSRFVDQRLEGLQNAANPGRTRSAWPEVLADSLPPAAPVQAPWWLTDGASLSAMMGLFAPGLRAQAC